MHLGVNLTARLCFQLTTACTLAEKEQPIIEAKLIIEFNQNQ